MGKATTYLLIASGLVLFFHLTGLIEPGTTVNSALLQFLLNPSDLPVSSFWTTVFGAVVGVSAAGAIIVGFVTKDLRSAAMVPATTFIFTLIWDVLAVFQVVYAASAPLALIFFGPLLVTLILTMIEFWGGTD